MTKLFETSSEFKDDGEVTVETVKVYEFDDLGEADDFSSFSHEEQCKEIGVKEEPTPSPSAKHGEMRRYVFDASDALLVVREFMYKW